MDLKQQRFILWFDEIGKNDVSLVGGKNANLGEMYRNLTQGGSKIFPEEKILVPYGFALSTGCYSYFLEKNNLKGKISEVLADLDVRDIKKLEQKSLQLRSLVLSAPIPEDLAKEIKQSFSGLAKKLNLPEKDLDVAVRSSSASEDLEDSSFAGLYESYLNVQSGEQLLQAIKKVFASLFNSTAISYRHDRGFGHTESSISVTVQKMVRSDLAFSGIMFTLDTENGFSNLVLINASYGLGELITKGEVTPDEYKVLKSMLPKGPGAIIEKHLGSKEKKLVYTAEHYLAPDTAAGLASAKSTKQVPVIQEDRQHFALSDAQVTKLAKWAVVVEEYFGKPMDIEWAFDGQNKNFYIVQARPETVQTKLRNFVSQEFVLLETGPLITQGLAVGRKAGAGKAHYITDVSRMNEFREGEVLVTDFADADWEPAIKIASAIVTNFGGRASHAAIIARELGIPAVVGTNDATVLIKTGQDITVSCAEGETGKVYEGILKFKLKE